jgi:hypothetical protein
MGLVIGEHGTVGYRDDFIVYDIASASGATGAAARR